MAVHEFRKASRSNALECRHKAFEIVIAGDRAMQEIGVDVDVLRPLASTGIDGKVAQVKPFAGVAVDKRHIIDIDHSSQIVKIIAGNRRRHG